MPECESGAKMITPREFQLPPRPNGASQMDLTDDFPSAATFFSCPSAKNPSDWPSADQNGKVAPSVPGIGSALSFERGRTQIWALPLESSATKAILAPSGESAIAPPPSPMRSKVVPSGGKTKERLEGTLVGQSHTIATRIKTRSGGRVHAIHLLVPFSFCIRTPAGTFFASETPGV